MKAEEQFFAGPPGNFSSTGCLPIMSDDWKSGDLALCVRGGRYPKVYSARKSFPVSGRIYTVVSYAKDVEFIDGPRAGLFFSDAPMNRGARVWSACRFRKIYPHVPDAEDEETIALMRGSPVPVG